MDAHQGVINCIDGIGGVGVSGGAPEVATGGNDGMDRVVKRIDRAAFKYLI